MSEYTAISLLDRIPFKFRFSRSSEPDEIFEALCVSKDGEIIVKHYYDGEPVQTIYDMQTLLREANEYGLEIIESDSESKPEQALRYNDGKPELSYILEADYAIEGVCDVLAFGAKKYDRGNYKKGFPKEKLVDSLLRHLTKFLNGEEYDEESGLHHTDHITANALFLAWHYNGRKNEKTSS